MNPGIASQVVFSAGLISVGLGVITPWLLPFGVLIDTFVYQAVTQCTNDPPAMPTTALLNPLNAIGGILNPNFQSWLTAVNNLLLNWAWDQFCQCVTGTATAVTYPSPPTDTTLPQGGTVVACSDLSTVVSPVVNVQTGTETGMLNTVLLPYLSFHVVNQLGQLYNASDVGTVPPNSIRSKTSWVSGTPSGGNVSPVHIFWDASGTELLVSTYQATVTTPGSSLISVPATTRYIAIQLNDATNSAGDTSRWLLEDTVYCTQGGTVGGQPCQPCPDPAVYQLLSTLLDLTESIVQSLPTQPNSYSESTVHSGLTGNGTLTIAASTIAIKAIITTDLPGGRIDLASPNYLFNRGYIVPIAAEGPIRGITRLVYNPQLFVLPHLTDQVGFSFPGGEVVTIIELTRGP